MKLFYENGLLLDGGELDQFCKASFFKHSEAIDISKEFTIVQKELVLNKRLQSDIPTIIKNSYYVKEVSYTCRFIKAPDYDNKLPTIIIPIRDSVKLLDYTLNNLKNNNIFTHSNVLVVDDRSSENIKEVAEKFKCSYLRVDNEKGFNFSMLNNIAAKICYQLKNEQVIFWNSDVWVKSELDFLNILEKHKCSNSSLSGVKLIYPPLEISLNKEKDTKNIKDFFPNFSNGKWRNTIQFGGEVWVYNASSLYPYSAAHSQRFQPIDKEESNVDRESSFVTGALQIHNLSDFISCGGFNPSLSKNYQDVDICLRYIENKNLVMYLGKDNYFYHDESLNMNNIEEETGEPKIDKQIRSDQVLFQQIWKYKLPELLQNFKKTEDDKLNRQKNKRDTSLCVYIHYDSENIFSKEDVHFVEHLKRNFSNIKILTGNSDDNTPEELIDSKISITYNIPNYGYDFGKLEYFLSEGRNANEDINKYDNFYIFNNSCIIVRDLGPSLEEMDSKKLDFWGYTTNRDEGTIHVQSYFYFLSKKAFNIFEPWLKKHSPFYNKLNMKEVIQKLEVKMMSNLLMNNLKCNSYLQTHKYYGGRIHRGFYASNHTIFMPEWLMMNKNFPLIKKKAFTMSEALKTSINKEYILHTIGEQMW